MGRLGCVCRSVDAQITAASDEMRSLRQRLADSLTRCFIQYTQSTKYTPIPALICWHKFP